ncbi:MAG TPA: iron-containing alcohol dehydrogenase [Bacteroidales bacterium]|nr:iron-containing alcohol dehydrogenase [Bacteroidales bacterium]
MESFIAYNPTSLHFGKDILNDLGKTVAKYGNRVLLVYGRHSIKQNGLYELVTDKLESTGATVFEFAGIKSNPVIEDVDAAAAVGRKHNTDVIVAVGGGSVIDSAKMISVTIPYEGKAWDFFLKKATPATAIPVIAVLTLAATGSEMNPFAVISNHEARRKGSYTSPLMFPKHSFLDPQFTISVPYDYTAYGIADLIAHCLEAYFGKGEATLSDRFVFSIIKEALENGPALLKDLTNYDLRARIMFAATMALNGLTMQGRASGDWGVHSIGHILSLLYDIPHGASLTIVYPAWLKLLKERLADRIAWLGHNIFNTDDVDLTIERLESFFKLIDCPVRLNELVPQPNIDEIVNVMILNKAATFVHKLDQDDYREVVQLMY